LPAVNFFALHIPYRPIVHRFRKYSLVLLLSFIENGVNAQCSAVINTFPYQEGFEFGTANWVSGGINNDWQWGSPSKPVINSAGAGVNCWITGGLTASFYNYGERSWVESPCFDFSTLNRPFISFLIFWETEKRYDGGNLQYSLDLGQTWKNVGTSSDPVQCNDQNWFNNPSVINLGGFVNSTQGWSGTTLATSGSCNGGSGSGAWKLASHCMKELANEPQVKFRFTFGSGTTCNDYDGLAFDNIFIDNAPSLPGDFTFTCINGNTLHFNDATSGCHGQWTWDFGDTLSSSNSSTLSNPDHTFSAGGLFTIHLTTGGACALDTQIIKQVQIISASIHSSPVSCIGDSDGTATVDILNPVPGISYSWQHNPLLNSAKATGLKPGNYSVSVSEPLACDLTLNVDVVYGPDANPFVSLGNDTVICPGSDIVLYPGSFATYLWQDNSTDSFYIAKLDGIYSITISNATGCKASDTLFIAEDCIRDIVFPNSFTPNGDGLNEIFKAVGSHTSEFTIYIFDRWGEKIFSTINPDQGWDGSIKGNPVQEGFYNYLVNYSINGAEKTRRGSIYLFR
jgi:gliding motility-associated-like protein